MQLCEQTFKPTQLQKQIVIVRNHFATKQIGGIHSRGKKLTYKILMEFFSMTSPTMRCCTSPNKLWCFSFQSASTFGSELGLRDGDLPLERGLAGPLHRRLVVGGLAAAAARQAERKPKIIFTMAEKQQILRAIGFELGSSGWKDHCATWTLCFVRKEYISRMKKVTFSCILYE